MELGLVHRQLGYKHKLEVTGLQMLVSVSLGRGFVVRELVEVLSMDHHRLLVLGCLALG